MLFPTPDWLQIDGPRQADCDRLIYAPRHRFGEWRKRRAISSANLRPWSGRAPGRLLYVGTLHELSRRSSLISIAAQRAPQSSGSVRRDPIRRASQGPASSLALLQTRVSQHCPSLTGTLYRVRDWCPRSHPAHFAWRRFARLPAESPPSVFTPAT
jgi:hypothetical protein